MYLRVVLDQGCRKVKNLGWDKYSPRAITSRGLYIFYPNFQFGLSSRAVNITDNFCTKQRNLGLKSAVYNQERLLLQTIYVLNKEIWA